MAAKVEVENLIKIFNKEQVLQSVSICFEAGQIHGIVGSNGSGKTVLLKCICGFMKPDSGTVKVNGKVIGKDVDFPQKTGAIIETPGFLPTLSAYNNLRILASLNGKPDRERICGAIRRVGLDPESKKHVSRYSLGMRQRLGIAQAIMDDPELLVLDEPFNGLDKNGAAQMRVLLKELKAQGSTILLTSHNQNDIDELCDAVCEMDAGVLTVIKQSAWLHSPLALHRTTIIYQSWLLL